MDKIIFNFGLSDDDCSKIREKYEEVINASEVHHELRFTIALCECMAMAMRLEKTGDDSIEKVFMQEFEDVFITLAMRDALHQAITDDQKELIMDIPSAMTKEIAKRAIDFVKDKLIEAYKEMVSINFL